MTGCWLDWERIALPSSQVELLQVLWLLQQASPLVNATASMRSFTHCIVGTDCRRQVSQ